MYYESLKKKIENKEAVVSIIGMGYVGLPIAVLFAEKKFKVYGIEIDRRKYEHLIEGNSYIDDVTSKKLKKIIKGDYFIPTQDFSNLKKSDCIILCVPTPLNKTGDPDVSFILDATERISENITPGKLITLESTSYPGTTRELILPKLEETGLKVGQDFFLAFSPERIDPGNKKYTVKNIPKVVGGITENCTNIAIDLYNKIIDKTVKVSSTEVSEMTKLLENTFRSINIALVNELTIMCNLLGIDVWEVIEAAATKPFGFTKFYPGPGLGGHCIPVDPFYLSWKLRNFNYSAKFIELAGEINSYMPKFVLSKIIDALNTHKKAVKGSKILVLGLAYKKDINDTRESPAVDILEMLKEKGADVYYSDPHIKSFKNKVIELKSQILTEDLIKSMDCIVVATDHSRQDYDLVLKHSKLIIDTRNVYKDIKSKKIVRL